MLLYNTLSRSKEEFVPVTPGVVNMYVCGITAYDYCHLGHARSAIVFDVLARYLRDQNYKLTFTRNFTDVDDKIINKANADGISSSDVSTKFIAAFHEDMDRLAVLRPDFEPKATENIPEMVALCEKLIEQKNAYATPSGDVYYRVESFAEYGKLSNRSLDDMQAGARVTPGEEKENPMDFALWKGAKTGEPSWPSPWGNGRPGWHIECSAMSEKLMPLPLDIHGGGQDLIFPHHENEIAQSEAACHTHLANFWVHNGFVQINAEKMSKSLGNFTTIRAILHQYLPETLRFFLLTKHYRSPIDFNTDAVEDTEKNLKKIYMTLKEAHSFVEKSDLNQAEPKEAKAFAQEALEIKKLFDDAMADDINTAAALGHVNSFVHLMNKMLETKGFNKSEACKTIIQDGLNSFKKWSTVLGIFNENPDKFLFDLKEIIIKRNNIDVAHVEDLIEQRKKAKDSKNFELSDKMRDELIKIGVEVRDTKDGTTWDVL